MWLLFGNANLRFEIGPSPDALPHDSAYVVSVMASDVAVANGSQDAIDQPHSNWVQMRHSNTAQELSIHA